MVLLVPGATPSKANRVELLAHLPQMKLNKHVLNAKKNHFVDPMHYNCHDMGVEIQLTRNPPLE
jgi:hypothetical protein